MSAEEQMLRAARALRDETSGPSDRAGATRAHVLAAALGQRRRSRRVAWVLPFAAAFALLSTAWASTRPWFPRLFALPERRDETHDVVAGPSAPPAVSSAPVPTSAPPVVSVDALPRAEAPRAPSASPPRAPRLAAPPAPPPPSASVPAPSDPGADLYAAAHRAHFVDRDPAAALRGWDAYLAAAPDGPFVPEARYNRALSLARLGRRDDARRALAPFADGAYGAYRQREARALLDALESREPR